MIYVASLYSNGIMNLPEEQRDSILEQRVNYTMKRVNKMMMDKKFPYSPILHCHEMSKTFDMPKEYDFWQEIDRNAIDHCDSVVVLMMSDEYGSWEKSAGITDEVYYAEMVGKEVIYLVCNDYELKE